MASHEVDEVKDTLWSYRCAVEEFECWNAEAKERERLASQARVWANTALLRQLACADRLERLGVEVPDA